MTTVERCPTWDMDPALWRICTHCGTEMLKAEYRSPLIDFCPECQDRGFGRPEPVIAWKDRADRR